MLLLRIIGMFEAPIAAAAVGALLCFATVSVFVSALVLANRDRLNEHEILSKPTNKKQNPDDYVVYRADGTREVMSASEFVALHEPSMESVSNPALAQEGFKRYTTTAQTWAHALSESDIEQQFPAKRFISSSGSYVDVRSGDFVAMSYPSKDALFVVRESEFDQLYAACDDGGNSLRSGHVPSQADVLNEWEPVLRQKALVYCKVSKVHAKPMPVAGFISTIEATTSYSKGDYVVAGSRGGKFAMQSQAFEQKYDQVRYEQASDAELANAGFKLYSAKGKVWAHELSADEQLAHFPSGQFIGKWGGAATVEPGSYLVMPFPAGDEIYSARRKLFSDIYQNMPNGMIDYVPSQEEALAAWKKASNQGDGRLYRSRKTILAIPPPDTIGDHDAERAIALQKSGIEAERENAPQENDIEELEAGSAHGHEQQRTGPVAERSTWGAQFMVCSDELPGVAENGGGEADAVALARRIEALVKELAMKEEELRAARELITSNNGRGHDASGGTDRGGSFRSMIFG